jgi:hypothetical protein
MAAISCAVHPTSASRRAAALRRPCAEQCGSPALSHSCQNHFENAIAVKGPPYWGCQKGQMVTRSRGNDCSKVEVHRNYKLGAGLLLLDAKRALTNVLLPHANHVTAPLPGVE